MTKIKKFSAVSFLFGTIFLFGFFFFAPYAKAASYTAIQDGNWSDNATWGGGGHPGAGDSATISSHTVTLSADAVASTFTISGTGILDLNSHNLSPSSTITITAGTINDTGGIGQMRANADVNGTAGTWNGGALVFVSGGVSTWTAGNVNYYDVTVNAVGSVDVSGTAIVAHNLAYTAGFRLNVDTVNVAGDVTVGAGAGGGTATVVLNGTGAQSINFTGAGKLPNLTINKSSGSVSVDPSSNNIILGITSTGSFIITNSGSGFDLNGKTITSGIFTFTAGTLDLDGGIINPSSTITLTAGTINDTAGGGQIRASVAVNGTAGTWNSGTLVFVGNGVSTWTAGSVNYYDVTINAVGTVDVSGTATVTHNLAYTAGFRLNVDTVNVAGDISVGAGAGGGTATVVLNGTGDQSISYSAGGAFPNITINKASGIATLSTNATFVNLTITQGTLYANGKNLTVSGTFTNNGTLRVQGGETLALTPDTAEGTVEYVGDGGTTPTFNISNCYGNTYYSLKINDASSTTDVFQPTAAASVTINGNTTISAGVLKTGTGTFTFGTNAVNTVIISGGELDIQSTNTQTKIVKNATWTNSGGKIVYDSGSAVSTKLLSALSPYYNLDINSAGSTYTSDNNITVANNLSIIAGTLDVSATNYSLTIGGDFTRTGTFTPEQGAVIFNDATKTSHIYGSTSFYDFTSTTAGKELDVEANSTEIITHTFTLTGAAGNLIKIRSTTDGTQSKINPTGAIAVSFVDVKDSNNLNGVYIDPASSTDSGGNTYWFTPAPTTTPCISNCGGGGGPVGPIQTPVYTPTYTPASAQTPNPSETPKPSNTPEPSENPRPTEQPITPEQPIQIIPPRVIQTAVSFSVGVGKIIANPIGSALTRTITTAGVVISLVSILFSSPFSFSEIFLLPARLFSILLSAYGLKKKIRPWGIVYDSVTKQPLDPAYVILNDLQGKEVSSAITDLDGRYGFLVPAGRYVIKAQKSHHIFPSQKLAGKTRDELYDNLYFGQEIEIKKSGEAIIKNIPLDPIEFDWNEFVKKSKGLTIFYSQIDNLVRRISNIFFIFGFILAFVAFLTAPFPYNTIIFCLYLLLILLRTIGIKPRSFGSIVEKETKIPLSFGVVRVISPGIGVEIKHAVADQYGRYYCLVPKGYYDLRIERKNQDGSYSPVLSVKNYNAKKGIVRERFRV